MAREPYYQLNGFDHVYLEDSYVLDIQINPASVQFSLSIVLTKEHPLYKPPLPGEQYCYRDGLLIFPELQRVELLKNSIRPAADVTGAVDYGNIDEFYLTDGRYNLNGDWGRMEVTSSPARLEFS